MGRVDPWVWTASDFSRECVQPGSPPAERAACDDLMLACRHQLHVAKAVFPFVPVHKVYLVLLSIQTQNFVVLLCPCHTSRITENIEYRLRHLAADEFHATLEITESVAVIVASSHVTPPCMNGYSILTQNQLHRL